MMTKQQKIWVDDAAAHLEDDEYLDFKSGVWFWHERAQVLEEALLIISFIAGSTAAYRAEQALKEYRGEK